MITIEPIHGLCNRMRTIDSALALAHALSTDLRIVWARTAECGAPFSVLFEPLGGVALVERGLWANRVMRRFELGTGRYTRVLREAEIGDLLATNFDFTRLAAEPSTFIQTHGRFFPSSRPFWMFVPTAPLAAEIDRVSSEFAPATFGVHVRRTDNARAIDRSPTSAFAERMARELETNADTQFFLATDSPRVEAELVRAFPGRIVARPKVRDRRSAAGIRDAVVDLYCLSRTHRIIGSYFSSFSNTAAEIGGVPIEIIDRQAEP